MPVIRILIASIFITASVAQAQPSLQIGPVGNAMMISPTMPGTTLFQDNLDGTFDWEGSMMMVGMWQAQWDLLIDTDPGVSGVFAITNTSGMQQSFVFNVATPVSVSVPAGAQFNSSSALTLADANFNGTALLAAPTGSSVFAGLIDGAVESTLYNDPFSLLVGAVGGTAVNAAGDAGTTSRNLVGTLGITHSIVLSPGDSATANSTFFVVPEPTSAALMLGAGMVLIRRRKKTGVKR